MPLRDTSTEILSQEEMNALLALYRQRRSGDGDGDGDGGRCGDPEGIDEVFAELEAIAESVKADGGAGGKK